MFDQTTNPKAKIQKKKAKSKDPHTQELNNLFNDIVAEIEERQEFLKSLGGLKAEKLRSKTKAEILERVSELEKLTDMIKSCKSGH